MTHTLEVERWIGAGQLENLVVSYILCLRLRAGYFRFLHYDQDKKSDKIPRHDATDPSETNPRHDAVQYKFAPNSSDTMSYELEANKRKRSSKSPDRNPQLLDNSGISQILSNATS